MELGVEAADPWSFPGNGLGAVPNPMGTCPGRGLDQSESLLLPEPLGVESELVGPCGLEL